MGWLGINNICIVEQELNSVDQPRHSDNNKKSGEKIFLQASSIIIPNKLSIIKIAPPTKAVYLAWQKWGLQYIGAEWT